MRQLVPSEHAPAILALFRLRAAKRSWSECCKLLEDAGVPNAKGKAEWLHSSVQAIIRNPVYRGWAHLLSKGKQDGDIVNETAHQPIVTRSFGRQPSRRRASRDARQTGRFSPASSAAR